MKERSIRAFAAQHGAKATTAATVLILVLQNAGLIGTVRGGFAAADTEGPRVAAMLTRHLEHDREVIEILKATQATNRVGLQMICVQLAKSPDTCLRIQ
jgi:hypothetical protein